MQAQFEPGNPDGSARLAPPLLVESPTVTQIQQLDENGTNLAKRLFGFCRGLSPVARRVMAEVARMQAELEAERKLTQALRLENEALKLELLSRSGFSDIRPYSTQRDIVTPAWTSVSWAGTHCSERVRELAAPLSRMLINKTSPRERALPPLAWGTDSRLLISEPCRLGDNLSTPRSVDPHQFERPIALTKPKLSAHYRVPQYVPPSSRKGASPPKSCPISQRSPRALARTTTPHLESTGKHLYDAVRRGDVAELRELSKHCPPSDADAAINYKGAFGNTPLMSAVARGEINAVRVLIAAGANVHVADKFGSTPLHHAARCGHLPICEMLVKAGARHDAHNKHNKSPIDYAREHTNVVIYLEKLANAHEAGLPYPKARTATSPSRRAASPRAKPAESTTAAPLDIGDDEPSKSRPLPALENSSLDPSDPLGALKEQLMPHLARSLDLFRIMDTNVDGVVSKVEFHEALSKLDLEGVPTRAVSDALFDECDLDGSGTFEYKELHRLLRRRVSPPARTVPLHASEDAAAINVQKAHRGKNARKNVKEKVKAKKMEAAAATKVQSIQRGKNARAQVRAGPVPAPAVDSALTEPGALSASETEPAASDPALEALAPAQEAGLDSHTVEPPATDPAAPAEPEPTGPEPEPTEVESGDAA